MPLAVRLSALATSCALLSAGVTYTALNWGPSSVAATHSKCRSGGDQSNIPAALPIGDQILNLSSLTMMAFNLAESIDYSSSKGQGGHVVDESVPLGHHRGFVELTVTGRREQTDPNFGSGSLRPSMPWFDREPDPLAVSEVDISWQRPYGDLEWVDILPSADGSLKIISVLPGQRRGADQLNISVAPSGETETGYRIKNDGSLHPLFTERCQGLISGDETQAMAAAFHILGLALAELNGPPGKPTPVLPIV